ncbi:hypothetical protein Bca4012_044213 [Brassica carinata]
MSGNTKDKIAVRNNTGKTTPPATAHMANDYANATVPKKKRPVRPQKGPPLGSLLNPHRNAFRFVSIGVSVEILRRKQAGLFLACFHSLRSDLSDLHSLHSDLSGLRKDSSWLASTRYVATCQTFTRYIATCQASERSSFRFSFESSSKRFSFRLNRNFR